MAQYYDLNIIIKQFNLPTPALQQFTKFTTSTNDNDLSMLYQLCKLFCVRL